jgi:RHS repeat-associated protein
VVTMVRRYYRTGATVIAVREITPTSNTVTWLGADVQGSQNVSVANNGTVSKQYYTPYGAPRGGDPKPTEHGHLGQIEDTHTNLTYLNARYYDPHTNTFITVDPLVQSTGTPYLYANANPTTMSDPGGRSGTGWGGSSTCGQSHTCESASTVGRFVGAGPSGDWGVPGAALDEQLKSWAPFKPSSPPTRGDEGDRLVRACYNDMSGNFSASWCSRAALDGNVNAQWIMYFLANQVLNGVVNHSEGGLAWALYGSDSTVHVGWDGETGTINLDLSVGGQAGLNGSTLSSILTGAAVLLYVACPLSEGATCGPAAALSAAATASQGVQAIVDCAAAFDRTCAASAASTAIGFIPGPFGRSGSVAARGVGNAAFVVVKDAGGRVLGTILTGGTSGTDGNIRISYQP